MKEKIVHVPEAILESSRLGRGGCGEGVRVDLGQREVPKRETSAPTPLPLHALDLSKRLSRVRALVVAVLDDEWGVWAPTDVIDGLVERLDGWLHRGGEGVAPSRCCSFQAAGFSRTSATPWPDPTHTPSTP